MNLIDIYNSNGITFNEPLIEEILAANEETEKYGLILRRIDASDIIASRNIAINELGRLETGSEIITKIIYAFSPSVYINSNEYARIVCELVEIFYHMKNETDDQISDDELIEIMCEYFNSTCQGSINLLKYRELTTFVEKFQQTVRLRSNEEKGQF